MASISTTPDAVAAPLRAGAAARVLAGRVPLVAIFAAAALLQSLQSLGHRVPLVFSDELLYTEFSRGLAEGKGLSIWGDHQLFPSPLLPLVHAPLWWLPEVSDAYLGARLLNAVVMAAAAFPAYWLARRLVRHSHALLVAASAVALPELGFHDSLMAEPLAYPLFLLAAAAIVRAVADGGRGLQALAVAACVLATATRIQMGALVVAYAVSVLVASERRRAHAVPLGILLGLPLVAFALLGTTVLGQYNGFLHLGFHAGGVAHWVRMLLVLLPFSFGLTMLPGAVLGLAARPRNRAELAFLVFTGSIGAIVLTQAGIIAAGDAQRTLIRYVFYLAPLLVTAFFLYVERGAPRRLVYVALALAGGLGAARLPFGDLTPPGFFDFEAPTATVFAMLQHRIGIPATNLAVELAVLVAAVAVAAVPLRGRNAPVAVACAGIAVSLGLGLAFARADHDTTRAVADRLAPRDLDWIDHARLGPVTYLSLPANLIVPDCEVAFWNRSIAGVAQFSTAKNGALPLKTATISAAGRLLISGRPNPPGRYVVGAWGSRIGIEGELLGRSDWLTARELPRGARVRWLASGLDRNGYSGATLGYRAWLEGARRPGRFTVRLALPAGRGSERVEVRVPGGGSRTLVLQPGGSATIRLESPATLRPELSLVARALVPSGRRERGVLVERIAYRRL